AKAIEKSPHAAPSARLSTSRLARRSDSPGTGQSAGDCPVSGLIPKGGFFALGRSGGKKWASLHWPIFLSMTGTSPPLITESRISPDTPTPRHDDWQIGRRPAATS